jgi:hypothetical protein
MFKHVLANPGPRSALEAHQTAEFKLVQRSTHATRYSTPQVNNDQERYKGCLGRSFTVLLQRRAARATCTNATRHMRELTCNDPVSRAAQHIQCNIVVCTPARRMIPFFRPQPMAVWSGATRAHKSSTSACVPCHELSISSITQHIQAFSAPVDPRTGSGVTLNPGQRC